MNTTAEQWERVREALSNQSLFLTPPFPSARAALAALRSRMEQLERTVASRTCEDCPGGPDQTERALKAEARVEQLEQELAAVHRTRRAVQEQRALDQEGA